MKLTSKNVKAYEILMHYEGISPVEYCLVVNKKIGILLELMESLVQEKIDVKKNLGWSESLIQKLCLHSVAMMNITKGIHIPFGKNPDFLHVADKASVRVLLRAVIECYLTFYYLYIDNVSENEKEFRMLVWKYSGLKQRVNFQITSEELRDKVENGKLEVETLRQEIVSSDFFAEFKTDEKDRIIKGLKPRLFFSWQKLISKSGLRLNLFGRTYSFQSNYAHAEFLSVQQIKAGLLKFDSLEGAGYELTLLHYLIAKCISEVQIIFPSITQKYILLEDDLKTEIEFLNLLACEKPDYSNWTQEKGLASKKNDTK